MGSTTMGKLKRMFVSGVCADTQSRRLFAHHVSLNSNVVFLSRSTTSKKLACTFFFLKASSRANTLCVPGTLRPNSHERIRGARIERPADTYDRNCFTETMAVTRTLRNNMSLEMTFSLRVSADALLRYVTTYSQGQNHSTTVTQLSVGVAHFFSGKKTRRIYINNKASTIQQVHEVK